MEITSNNIVNYETYFPKVRQFNIMLDTIVQQFIPPNKNNPYFLYQDPRDNGNIIINYNDNNKLFWIEPPKIFNINEYKYYTLNYKSKIITKVYYLLYFVPIFIIIYYIKEKIFEIRAPENESMKIDENYKIISISKNLKNFAQIGETLFDYNLNVKKSYPNNNNKEKDNIKNIINKNLNKYYNINYP